MNTQKLILSLAVIAKLVLSILICSYFWSVSEIDGIKQLPIYILVLCVIYIGLQMITRRISMAQHWWDWVYYIGLLCIMIPVMFANEKSADLYHIIVDYGTLLLVLPVLVDGWLLVKPNSNKE